MSKAEPYTTEHIALISMKLLSIRERELLATSDERDRRRAELEAYPERSAAALGSFVTYCRNHPSERFWQALRNWSRWNFILGSNTWDGAATIDTFNVEGLDGTANEWREADRG